MSNSTKPKPTAETDNDIHKGAVEDDRPNTGRRSNHPGLDDKGLPNDPVAIAQDRVGANVDESQG